MAESLATLQRVLPAAGDPAPSGKQLEQVLAAGEQVRAADLLMRAHFGTIRERLEEVGVGDEIFARLATAETSYGDAMDELLGALPPTAGKAVHGELAAIGERLAAQLSTPPPPILRGGVLPYRPAGLAPRAPRTAPAVVPSYLNPLAEDPTSADLAATPEAPLDDEILAFAASLDHDYVRIYEYVRNEITSEWYAGSQKGAVGTLRDGSGNDVDQASLLIALFRASQLAARYVHGVVELEVEAVADDLGLTDPAAVPDALARAGVAYTPVIRGGRVATVQVEHTWVDAYLAVQQLPRRGGRLLGSYLAAAGPGGGVVRVGRALRHPARDGPSGRRGAQRLPGGAAADGSPHPAARRGGSVPDPKRAR